ncbi:APC family permease [Brevibacterium luteolum]|uniref:Amino acid permease n=1 Tax=Brevibacterium luteolum TaxID=199591 RepID=A0A849APA6_9MICO|nr:APC family permease [Brevibacterium luteolum]MBM7529736.1 amino acid transporter [Brevibacterium luteolum]NNG78497.1 amino acid permease [Brevibacterium luteolum]
MRADASTTNTPTQHDADAAHLASLGYSYDKQFKREMSFFGNVSLGFTYLSPVVGVYSLFAVSLASAGPPMLWSLLIVAVGQMMVALVFGEVVSNFPVSGGVYPWSRRLWGRRWAWMNGWVYLISLLVTIASVAYGSGMYLGALFGFEPGPSTTITCALGMIAIATLLNFGGTKVVSLAASIGLIAELGGALIVGGGLIVFARHNDLGVLFNGFGSADNFGGNYFAAFAAAGLIGVYQYYGFEACGDVAEEVPNPGRQIPKAMRMTIYVGGAAATFVCLSLILATPDIAAVVRGDVADPVGAALLSAFGPIGYRIVLLVVLISFASCVLSLQAAASRLGYSLARDHMLPLSGLLGRFSDRLHVPPFALLVAGLVPAGIILGSRVSTNALTAIISFASLGIYLGFQMVVIAALRARLKGWKPAGAFTLGKWGLPANLLALGWGATGIINMVWPRTPGAPWYENYLVLISGVVVVTAGLIYMLAAKPYLKSDTPHGDAHVDPMQKTPTALASDGAVRKEKAQ